MLKKNIKKMLHRVTKLLPVFLLSAVVYSCYYDYTLESTTYDLVGTFHNTEYNFNNVTKYYFVDSVFHFDTEGNVTRAYDSQIKSTIISNLNKLNWTRVTDTAGAGDVIVVSVGLTTGTVTVVNSGDNCWYDYYGYSWCDPYYTSYTFDTGTLVMMMADLHKREGTRLPIQWNGTLNGVMGLSGTSTPTRIINGINQAFTQSPYL